MAVSLARTEFFRGHATARSTGPFAQLVRLHDAWRQRQQLAGLDTHLLRDIGLDTTDASRAAARPGWDVGLPGLR